LFIHKKNKETKAMTYRAVGDRCAVDLKSIGVPLDENALLEILEKKGFRTVDVDMISLAEDAIGKANWKLPSGQWEAPHYFDCSSFTKWIYGQRGILIPRRPQQQFEFCGVEGKQLAREELLMAGDLLFVSSPFIHGKRTDEHNGIGHVCLMVDAGEVICATNSEFGKGVVKIPLHELCTTRKICGAGRIIPQGGKPITLITPPNREIETSDDVKWIVLQSLPQH
jgi:hypothetical protein